MVFEDQATVVVEEEGSAIAAAWKRHLLYEREGEAPVEDKIRRKGALVGGCEMRW